MMCAGEFYEKSAREAIQFFDTIAENARTWETNTSIDTAKVHSTPTGGGIHHLRENDDFLTTMVSDEFLHLMDLRI